MNEETKTPPAKEKTPLKQIIGATIITVILLGLAVVYLANAEANQSSQTVDQIIVKIRTKEKRWEVINQEKITLEVEATALREECANKSREEWGEDAECPIKKKLNF